MVVVHNHTDCRPVSEILHQIGGKWTMLVVTQLGEGSMRFSELKREIGSVSQKVLTATLRELEMDGFVTRTVTPSIPPRVDYELTDLGRSLLVPVQALGVWAIEKQEEIKAARRRYLAEHPDAVPGRSGHAPALSMAAE